MNPTILVYGWYNQSNLGDDLFMSAFKHLFPEYNFVFTSHITTAQLQNISAVFIGGGSFLNEPMNASNEAMNILLKKKIFYIGIGIETNIHPHHLTLMKVAKLIAARNDDNLKSVCSINSNTIVIPDLVYSLTPSFSQKKIDQSILIFPNIVVVPKWSDPHWKHAAWDYFKTEFAQFLDELIEQECSIKFFPMCTNYEQNDNNAAIEIINRMSHRSGNYLLDKQIEINSVTETISQYSAVITQRYHGIILSHMSKVPCLSLYHHDKLKSPYAHNLPYYGLNKGQLLSQLDNVLKDSEILPIDRNIFNNLKQIIIDLI